jgi:hypothetical protein
MIICQESILWIGEVWTRLNKNCLLYKLEGSVSIPEIDLQLEFSFPGHMGAKKKLGFVIGPCYG